MKRAALILAAIFVLAIPATALAAHPWGSRITRQATRACEQNSSAAMCQCIVNYFEGRYTLRQFEHLLADKTRADAVRRTAANYCYRAILNGPQ